ncbi:MAG: hypothetical protein NZ925_01100, partial [Sulfolobales archaeon]|nr:hypothetical protein [Sulfolobales archaeon]
PILPIYVRFWIQVHRKELSGVVDMPGGALNFWTLISGNFRGIPAELPYTEIKPPVAVTPPAAATVTVVRTVVTTVATPVTVTYATTTEVRVPHTPPEVIAVSVVAVVAIGAAMFLIGRRTAK